MKTILNTIYEKRWFVPLILLILVIISYGQTLQMYFLIDDNALIYKLQHLNENLGYWGEGFWGSGPYRHIVPYFVPFYPIFGVNPMPYFAVGLALYYLATLSLFYFIKFLTKNSSIAFVAALIFSAGYIGADTMFGIVNSWQTMRGIIMIFVLLATYLQFIQSKLNWYKRSVFYIFSLGLFYLLLETVYIRAHGLIFVIALFDLLYWPTKKYLKSAIKSAIRMIPFLYVYYYVYLKSTSDVAALGIANMWGDASLSQKLIMLTVPIQNLGNAVAPFDFTLRISDRFADLQSKGFYFGSLVAGLSVLFIAFWVWKKYSQKRTTETRLIIFALGYILANLIGFFAREPLNVLRSTHRYYSFSFVGTSIFVAVLIYILSVRSQKLLNTKILAILTLFSVGTFFYLNVNYQREFNLKRSIPAKAFFRSFNVYVPEIKKGDLYYFDLQNDTRVANRFGSYFGGMFSEAANLAIYNPEIDYMHDILFTYDFNDIPKLLESGDITPDNVHTFYYRDSGLVDTTDEVKRLLSQESEVEVNLRDEDYLFETTLDEEDEMVRGTNPEIALHIENDIPSLAPSSFSFTMTVEPIVPDFPYLSTTQDIELFANADTEQIYSYLISRGSYYKEAVATSASWWKEQVPELAIDNRLDTAWRGNRIFWDEAYRGNSDEIEFFEVDIGNPREISGVKWVSAQKPLVPSVYRLLASLDSESWKVVKEIDEQKLYQEGSEIYVSFEPTLARYIRMEINKTYGNDGPEIKEFEVIEFPFDKLDKDIVSLIYKNPFAYIETRDDYETAYEFAKNNTYVKFFWQSSADTAQDPDKYTQIQVEYNQPKRYELKLPAEGMKWSGFVIDGISIPSIVKLDDLVIKYTPL